MIPLQIAYLLRRLPAGYEGHFPSQDRGTDLIGRIRATSCLGWVFAVWHTHTFCFSLSPTLLSAPRLVLPSFLAGLLAGLTGLLQWLNFPSKW